MFLATEKLKCPKCGKFMIADNNSKIILCKYCGHAEQL